MISNECRIALLSPAVGTGNIGDYLIEHAIRRLLRGDIAYRRFSIRRPLASTEIDQINATDFAILCGTNLYQHKWESALTPVILDRIRVPVIPCGMGSSAATLDQTTVSTTTANMIRALHERCTVGGVRDPHSEEVVKRIGISNVRLTGCPVLFWVGGESLPPIQALRRRRVLITARNWLMHRDPDNVDHPVQVAVLRGILAGLPAEQIRFVIHEDFDTRLVSLLSLPRGAVFHSDNFEDYVRLYSDPANVILAMRLHAGMLGLANGLPVVFVGHDTRTYSFCGMLGIPCVELFSENCVSECLSRLGRILDGDVSGLSPDQEVFGRLRTAMNAFLVANALPRR
jgi:polysaccharide pyruvyl transferase WcaK-like protein